MLPTAPGKAPVKREDRSPSGRERSRRHPFRAIQGNMKIIFRRHPSGKTPWRGAGNQGRTSATGKCGPQHRTWRRSSKYGTASSRRGKSTATSTGDLSNRSTRPSFRTACRVIWLTSVAAPLGGTKSVDYSKLPAVAEFDYIRDFAKALRKRSTPDPENRESTTSSTSAIRLSRTCGGGCRRHPDFFVSWVDTLREVDNTMWLRRSSTTGSCKTSPHPSFIRTTYRRPNSRNPAVADSYPNHSRKRKLAPSIVAFLL